MLEDDPRRSGEGSSASSSLAKGKEVMSLGAASGLSATRRFLATFKKYLFQPFLIGFAVAFGMSLGYATYDTVSAKFNSFLPAKA
ncbi:hypothetical protein QOT17_017749 [Balamuthia mandrillaris]